MYFFHFLYSSKKIPIVVRVFRGLGGRRIGLLSLGSLWPRASAPSCRQCLCFWNALKPLCVQLSYSVTNLPWRSLLAPLACVRTCDSCVTCTQTHVCTSLVVKIWAAGPPAWRARHLHTQPPLALLTGPLPLSPRTGPAWRLACRVVEGRESAAGPCRRGILGDVSAPGPYLRGRSLSPAGFLYAQGLTLGRPGAR